MPQPPRMAAGWRDKAARAKSNRDTCEAIPAGDLGGVGAADGRVAVVVAARRSVASIVPPL
jgi:hypothetical protein